LGEATVGGPGLFADFLEQLELIPSLLRERHGVLPGEAIGAVAVPILGHRREKPFL
jgi:hypothetical protein